MFGKLLLVFIGIPFIEMLILIKLGEVMGFFWTIMLVIGTGFLGALAARIQGVKAWMVLQQELQSGRMPGEQMIDALLIFISGLMLMTPGLLTDIAGFLLLIPTTRSWIKKWVKNKIDQHLNRQREGFGYDSSTIEVERID
jgi:UPF0716 protein FxsA